jgi:hypothetical protein
MRDSSICSTACRGLYLAESPSRNAVVPVFSPKLISVPILACSRFLCLEESALGQFNCAKAQSIYRRPFGGRPRPLYRLRITTQQTSKVVGEPCNPLHSSNKDWRCLSVKPAELQWSYPHLDISPSPAIHILVVTDKLIAQAGVLGDLSLELGVASPRSTSFWQEGRL